MAAKYSTSRGNIGDPRPSQKAFTLIELLVVIAIIGVLASLLLPALWRAKESGRTAVCKSNLRQWGMAARMYVDDFGVYPPYRMSDFAGGPMREWYARLQRYAGSQSWIGQTSGPPRRTRGGGIEVCPSYEQMGGLEPAGGGWSYGYNVEGFLRTNCQELGLSGVLLKPQPLPGITFVQSGELQLTREGDVLCPSDMIGIGDAKLYDRAWYGVNLNGLDRLSTWVLPDPMAMTALGLHHGSPFSSDREEEDSRSVPWNERRHGGRFNVLFCDGHIEALSIKKLFDPRDDNVVKRWNRDNLPHRESIPPPSSW